ncbi:MAG: pyridoxal phosphate-dependent aminotransferase [Nitrospinaceae bacterium]
MRKMFEEGQKLREQFGEGHVFDLSLGNPVAEPPEILLQALVQAAGDTSPGLHRYMPNAGYPETRAAVAETLSAESGFRLTAEYVVMVCGAAGGLNIALKTLLDPGDEVIVFSPFFVEYLFYADNHGGKAVAVPTRADFTPDLEAFRQAVTPKTKAVIINSPNNPTGVVYSREVLTGLGAALREKSEEIGHPIYLLSDDPYSKIVFDDVETPHVFEVYEHSLYITSHSKDLAVPGERIGCVAVHPGCADAENMMGGLIFCNRVLGFVNAPALMQRVVRRVQGASVDVQAYRRRRDFLYAELTRIGYDVVRPQGAFYVFPKSPLADELAFIKILAQHRVLVVPGRGFGAPGYFRIAYCMPDPVIEGALQGFEAAFREAAG